MGYEYASEKARLFTDEGQRAFVAARDKILTVVREAGAIRCWEAMKLVGSGICDDWGKLAVVDRMEEIGDLRHVINFEAVSRQHQVYVAGRA